jgi:H+/Cl- antiporter ClcA
MAIIEGILFGIMGAALAAVYLVLAGLTRTVVGRAKSWLDARIGHWPRVVVLTTTGGAAVGALGWAMPLTLTDGAGQLNAVLFRSGQVGTSVLAASCFSKALAYHIVAECGFHGGLFLPMLAMSSMLGGVFINVTGVNPTVARSCAMIALGCALVPSPFAMAVLSMSALMDGPQGLVPIFATACTSYMLCLGVGWPQKLMELSAKRQQAAGKAT